MRFPPVATGSHFGGELGRGFLRSLPPYRGHSLDRIRVRRLFMGSPYKGPTGERKGGKAIDHVSPRASVARPRSRRTPSAPPSPVPSPLGRFRGANPYRARREWLRYEGTGQRDLFRELRTRFLERHSAEDGWVVDVGSGPGRFLPWIGGPAVRRVALDVSREMLRLVPITWQIARQAGPIPELVRGDAVRAPLRDGRWSEVVVLGNTLGFTGARADRFLSSVERLAGPDAILVLETAPGPGERSNYLARLPASSLARLLRAPVRAVLGRLDREGFRAEAPRHPTPRTFRRYSAEETVDRLRSVGWKVEETMAVAPALGADPARAAAVRADPKSWARLLELEEEIGRRPDRWSSAASVLLAARRTSSMRMIK